MTEYLEIDLDEEESRFEESELDPLQDALVRSDFLRVCAHAVRNGSVDFLATIEEQASKAEKLAEFQRDVKLARSAYVSEDAVLRVADLIAKTLKVEVDYGISTFKSGGRSKKPIPVRVCSPLLIAAVGSNVEREKPHLDLRIKTRDGTWNSLTLARTALTQGGWQSLLVEKGLEIADELTLKLILLNAAPDDRFDLAESAGWTNSIYVLPSGEVFGLPAHSGTVIAGFRTEKGFAVAGDLLQANELLRNLEGNSRAMLCIAAAMAAPAMYGLGGEPGGFHLFGRSSQGKTTVLCGAASIWGKGAEERDGGLVDSWNSTRFAAEELAAQSSDCPLFRDESRLVAPHDFQQTIYTLAQGINKAAGKKEGGLRQRKTFRPMLLSTGEMSSREQIEGGNLAYDAGMSVRLVDVPAVPQVGTGVFERVPTGMSGSDFAKYIRTMSAQHYGHHGRAFLNLLLADRAAVIEEIKSYVARIREILILDGAKDDQSGRVADRFAMVSGVAYFCIVHGILPWDLVAFVESMRSVYRDWLAHRGGSGSQEALSATAKFDANWVKFRDRFVRVGSAGAVHPRDCLGYTRVVDDIREIWFASDDALGEMVGGKNRVEDFLTFLEGNHSSEWCFDRGEGRNRKKRVPNPIKVCGTPSRMYKVTARNPVFGDTEDDDTALSD